MVRIEANMRGRYGRATDLWPSGAAAALYSTSRRGRIFGGSWNNTFAMRRQGVGRRSRAGGFRGGISRFGLLRRPRLGFQSRVQGNNRLQRRSRGRGNLFRGRGGRRGLQGTTNSTPFRGGGRRGRGRRNISENELDTQLDSYMGENSAKQRLDSQLDQYFGRAPNNATSIVASDKDSYTSDVNMTVAQRVI